MLTDDITCIRQVLQRERKWRVKVFNGHQRQQKVGEIDQALQALSRLEAHLRQSHPEGFLQQKSLL